jgi:hypothetical protein
MDEPEEGKMKILLGIFLFMATVACQPQNDEYNKLRKERDSKVKKGLIKEFCKEDKSPIPKECLNRYGKEYECCRLRLCSISIRSEKLGRLKRKTFQECQDGK